MRAACQKCAWHCKRTVDVVLHNRACRARGCAIVLARCWSSSRARRECTTTPLSTRRAAVPPAAAREQAFSMARGCGRREERAVGVAVRERPEREKSAFPRRSNETLCGIRLGGAPHARLPTFIHCTYRGTTVTNFYHPWALCRPSIGVWPHNGSPYGNVTQGPCARELKQQLCVII